MTDTYTYSLVDKKLTIVHTEKFDEPMDEYPYIKMTGVSLEVGKLYQVDDPDFGPFARVFFGEYGPIVFPAIRNTPLLITDLSAKNVDTDFATITVSLFGLKLQRNINFVFPWNGYPLYRKIEKFNRISS